jgi:hypothetical protein
MTLEISLKEALLPDEQEACQRYEVEATMLHACCQGRSSDFRFHPGFAAFQMRCAAEIDAIDRAIRKFEVTGEGSVFSGHGVGIGVVGSLRADPAKLVGFDYCYPGFISTSRERAVAEEKFIESRAGSGTCPVLLEFALRKGMSALDFSEVTNSVGEFEYLLGRKQRFVIVAANQYALRGVVDPVLYLVMEPKGV